LIPGFDDLQDYTDFIVFLFSITMTADHIIASISKHVQLTEEETSFFTSLLLPLHVRQHEFVGKTGEPAKYFIYVNSGCLMSYYTDKEDVDHVMQFATAGWWTGDLSSYMQQNHSIYATRALTESDVWLLPRQSMDQLLDKYMKFEKYFRIIFQNSLINHQNRLIQNLSATAEERYVTFTNKYSALEQYVPLKYIASYLGMTPEFLSKIRRKLMDK
jgi:CRP-like cAMP-binding protein